MIKFIKHFLLGILFFFWSFVGVIVSLFRPFHANNGYMVSSWLMPFAAKILGIKLHTRNMHIVNDIGPAIIVSNHQSTYDIFLMSYSLPRRTVSIGKKSMRWIPIFGWWYWLAGHIFIDRGNRRKAFSTLDKVAEKIKKKNIRVLIFPEGTRSNGRGLLKFKNGAFSMAIKNKIPIIPVVMTDYKNLKVNKLGKCGDLIFEALPVIDTDQYTLDQVEDLKEFTREQFIKTQKSHEQEISGL